MGMCAIVALVLALFGCGPPTAPAAPNGGEPMPVIADVAASWAGLAVFVENSLAATQYRGAVLEALREAGVTIVDDGGAPNAITVQLSPGAGDVSMKSGFASYEITMKQQLGASVFHGGKLIDQLSATTELRMSGTDMLAANQRGVTWLARKIVQQLVGSPKLAAIAEGASVASAAPASGAPAGLLSGAPQAASYVLVVGVEAYRDLPAPKGARADALAFAEVAKTPFGVTGDRLRVALDDRATGADIRRGLKWLAETVPAGGRAYLYFSGHGAPDPSTGASYLVPYDGDPLALDETALPLSEVMNKLGGGTAGETLVILDSCFSGAGGRSVLPEGTRPLVRLRTSPVPGTVALLTAATGAQISGATEAGDRGLFTTHVVDALGRGRADIDGDAQITLAELMTWLGPRGAGDAKAAGREPHPSLGVGGHREPAPYVG
ncbi:MAG: caspase family protein, partial [Polyangiaceae bacterium]